MFPEINSSCQKDSQDWQQSKNCLMPPTHAIFSSAIVFGVLSYGIQLLGNSDEWEYW